MVPFSKAAHVNGKPWPFSNQLRGEKKCIGCVTRAVWDTARSRSSYKNKLKASVLSWIVDSTSSARISPRYNKPVICISNSIVLLRVLGTLQACLAVQDLNRRTRTHLSKIVYKISTSTLYTSKHSYTKHKPLEMRAC